MSGRPRLEILLLLCLILSVFAATATAHSDSRPSVDADLHVGALKRVNFSRHLSEATCIGSSLQPSQQLLPNEFLCRGEQRFGILDGRLILGLSTSVDENSVYNAVSPTQIAWQAAPTTLFVECSRPFHSLLLSPYGSLIGADSQGNVIYDSNLDYGNRLEGKVANSVLAFSTSCGNMMSVGELCLKLTSPPVPGMPWGMVTWGVVVDESGLTSLNGDVVTDSDDFVSLSLTDELSALDQTNITLSPSKEPTSTNPTFLPTSSPVIKSQSIIYGTVWLDSDDNGQMDMGEKPIAGVTIRLYQCYNDVNNTITLVDTKVTDPKGWYFFQVPLGSYKAYFDVLDLQVYKFTSGVDSFIQKGWTNCISATLEQPIQWNAGLHNVITSDRVPEAVAKPAIANSRLGGSIFIDLNGDGTMDAAESNAVENGYTVSDAIVHVSVHDCEANIMKQSLEVPFPGTYAFNDLAEGLYKVEFDIVSLKSNKQTKESRTPLYSFFTENEDSSSFETNCINLRRNDANTSVHAGIRIPKLKVNTKVSEDLLEQLEESSASNEKKVTVHSAEGLEKEQSVTRLVIGLSAGLAVLIGVMMFIYKRRDSLDTSVHITASDVKDDLSHHNKHNELSVDSINIVVKTKEEDGCAERSLSQHNMIEQTNTTRAETHTQIESRPYHSSASSLFEIESLGSDPYIFTGDEQESLGSDPYIAGGIRNDQYWQSNTAHQAMRSFHEHATHAAPADYDNRSYHCEESLITSNTLSSDPPAASYKDIPPTAQVYHHDRISHRSSYCHSRQGYDDDAYQNKITATMGQDEFPFESDNSSSSYEEPDDSLSSSSSTNDAAQIESAHPPFQPCTGWAEAQHGSQQIESMASYPHTGWELTDSAISYSDRQHEAASNSDTGPALDDQSVISAQSDQSADPPGASYQFLGPTSGRGCRGRYQFGS